MISSLLLSEVVLPDDHPRAGSFCPVYGFLIHHAQGAVLVDTGVGVGHAGIDAAFTPTHHSLEDAIRAAGVQLAEVTMVINSHLHFDHCGNNLLFPGVPLVVQRAEYEAAGEPDYTIPEWIDFPGAQWEPVHGEAEVLPGVVVFPTPGHTEGHQSVLVHGVEGVAGVEVIAGQAVYDRDELAAEQSIEALSPKEAEQTAVSARGIKAANPERVFFSHDSRIWEPGPSA